MRLVLPLKLLRHDSLSTSVDGSDLLKLLCKLWGKRLCKFGQRPQSSSALHTYEICFRLADNANETIAWGRTVGLREQERGINLTWTPAWTPKPCKTNRTP